MFDTVCTVIPFPNPAPARADEHAAPAAGDRGEGARIIDLVDWRYTHRIAPMAEAQAMFPPPSASPMVKAAWADAMAGLNDRDRRIAALLFQAELREAHLRVDDFGDVAYRHLVARLLYRDELVWRRNHGDLHAFARQILIRFAKALARRGVA